MPKEWARAGLAILIDALAVTFVTALLALLYWLATGANGEYLTLVSNVIFVEGGAILTFGALVAFFKMRTVEIRRLIYNPVLPFERRGFFRDAGKDDKDEERDAGWLLIFLGATLIGFSILMSLDYLI